MWKDFTDVGRFRYKIGQKIAFKDKDDLTVYLNFSTVYEMGHPVPKRLALIQNKVLILGTILCNDFKIMRGIYAYGEK